MNFNPMSIADEQHFWLANLRDHASSMRDHLSPVEQEWLELAEQYKEIFEQLLEETRWLFSNHQEGAYDPIQLSRRAQAAAYGYFRFEGHMQHLRLQHLVDLHMSPTTLNSTLNENQEYLRLLYYWSRGEDAPPLPLADLTGLWLESHLDHASQLSRYLDEAEQAHIQQASQFKHQLQGMLAKNAAIRGYLRFSPPGFPLQCWFAIEIAQLIHRFADYLTELTQLHKQGRLLSNCTAHSLSHPLSESRYFLTKLSAYVPPGHPN